MSVLISPAQHPTIEVAIRKLTAVYGHPDNIPLGELEKEGLDKTTANTCEAVLSSYSDPSPIPEEAIHEWLHQIKYFSEHAHV